MRFPSFFGNDRKTMPRIVFPAVGKTTGMQSEPGWPQIILHVYRRPPGEEGAQDRDPSACPPHPNMTANVDILGYNFVPSIAVPMEKETNEEDLYEAVKFLHVSLERRLAMLHMKAFLSEDEEIEMKVLKKRKLRCKDIMEGLRDVTVKGSR